MNERQLRKAISLLPLGEVLFFDRTGSTNDVALARAAEGAPDLSLVYAEEQTAGRGRLDRRWFTPAGAALAFSLVLRLLPGERQALSLFSGLGALAVAEALEARDLQPLIKWPNDLLIQRRKVCGVLAEAVWTGERLDSMVLGIGLNVAPASVPPAGSILFPATCLEAELPASRRAGPGVDRAVLLRDILQALIHWRSLIGQERFMEAWQARLAFRGEQVEVVLGAGTVRSGQLQGLEPDGALRLGDAEGRSFTVQYGDVHLRPVV
jgi:BirA family biotin operon repressor/biotin-[acetyl-CoA-carboxylase] ligase